MVKISEINTKSILTRSKVMGIDYTICPYIGCLHRCIYCYVRFMGFVKDVWGNFLYVKKNAPELLKRAKIKKGSRIAISTATDPYQPAERKYRLTRAILKELTKYSVSVSILTKSALVIRDIDIFKDMADIEVGFSITTVDENIRETIEPDASKIIDRLTALEKLKDTGIKTWVFIAPILPGITGKNIERLIFILKQLDTSRIVVDRLNYCKRLRLFQSVTDTYFEKQKQNIIRLCNHFEIPCNPCF
jgi:DNA repair photolyase